jgi:molybdate-binding protein
VADLTRPDVRFINRQSGSAERYFLLCGADRIATPVMQQALALLRSDALRDSVDALPGCSVDKIGAIRSELGDRIRQPPAPHRITTTGWENV